MSCLWLNDKSVLRFLPLGHPSQNLGSDDLLLQHNWSVVEEKRNLAASGSCPPDNFLEVGGHDSSPNSQRNHRCVQRWLRHRLQSKSHSPDAERSYQHRLCHWGQGQEENRTSSWISRSVRRNQRYHWIWRHRVRWKGSKICDFDLQ